MAAASRFCRGSLETADPFADGRLFVEQVAGFCRRRSITYVFPCHEDSLALREHEDILPEGVGLACPPADVIRRCIDKAQMSQFANSSGVAIPESAFPDSPDELLNAVADWGFPVVLKLRRANSGKGVYIETSISAIEQRIEQTLLPFFQREERAPYAQKFIDGDVLGSCFFAVDGKIRAFFGER